jgi:hypothetical protein
MRGNLLAAAFVLLGGCGTAQSIRPVGAGRGALDVSAGGPLIEGIGAPAPLLLVGYRHGLDDRTDLFGRLHLVPAAVGVVGLEAGASRLLRAQRGRIPAVSASAEALVFAGPGGALAVPAAALTASWSTGRWLLYAGSQQAVSFGRRLDGDGAAFHWSPYVGATRDVGRWTFGAELRWWEPHVGDDVLVWWQGIGGRGALAPMISISRRMGGDR